jgi:hypothetical protein
MVVLSLLKDEHLVGGLEEGRMKEAVGRPLKEDEEAKGRVKGDEKAIGLAVAGVVKQEALTVMIVACSCPLHEGGRTVDHNGAYLPRSRHLCVSSHGGLCAAAAACNIGRSRPRCACYTSKDRLHHGIPCGLYLYPILVCPSIAPVCLNRSSVKGG